MWSQRSDQLKRISRSDDRHTALRHDRISAPWVIDGPINGELFTLYVEKVLAPTLQPGEIVIWFKLNHMLEPGISVRRVEVIT